MLRSTRNIPEAQVAFKGHFPLRGRPMTLTDLKAHLFSTTDGLAACEAINDVAKLAEKGSDEAKTILTIYAQNGIIKHHRTHACSRLAHAIKSPDVRFAAQFREGLADPVLRYWSILGYLNSAGKSAYEELIHVAEDAAVGLADRAHAIKCLARYSKQKFDRGLPADPSFWSEQDLRLSEVRSWASSGFADGIDYPPPNRHATLDNPQTEFEKIVHKLDKKLAKERKKLQDPAEPTNWLVTADSQDINRIKARWELPATYLDFLTRFSPLRVIIKARKFYNPFWLYGAGELLDAQNGYAFNPIEKQPISDWPAHFAVVASHGGDPYVLDLSRSDGNDAPILTAEHGTGEWNFEPVAESFLVFLERLAR